MDCHSKLKPVCMYCTYTNTCVMCRRIHLTCKCMTCTYVYPCCTHLPTLNTHPTHIIHSQQKVRQSLIWERRIVRHLIKMKGGGMNNLLLRFPPSHLLLDQAPTMTSGMKHKGQFARKCKWYLYIHSKQLVILIQKKYNYNSKVHIIAKSTCVRVCACVRVCVSHACAFLSLALNAV